MIRVKGRVQRHILRENCSLGLVVGAVVNADRGGERWSGILLHSPGVEVTIAIAE